VAWAVAAVDVETIDRINIRRASLLAMRLAVQQLAPGSDYLLIDGCDTIDWPCPQQSVIQGDSISLSIAAASVLAKVHRDRLLVEFDSQFPGYSLANHKGYGTPEHLAALARLGPTPLHRKSFHPVANSKKGLHWRGSVGSRFCLLAAFCWRAATSSSIRSPIPPKAWLLAS